MNHELVWDVGGHPVAFRSDRELRRADEAVIGAFYVSASAAGVDLATPGPVDRSWLLGTAEIGRTIHRWWGFRPARVLTSSDPSPRPRRDGRPRALCFSLGVDSFTSLLDDRPDLLVVAGGYDVPLIHRARLDELERRVRAVADHVGLDAATVESDLREHPQAVHAPWPRTHGGALAALGHLLDVAVLRISASSVPGQDRPWGTHWELDRFHSSARTRVVHVGHHLTRFEKVGMLANHGVALDNLFVCWRLDDRLRNCGRCVKCVLVMAALDAHGALDRSPTFDDDMALSDRIDAVEEGGFPSFTTDIAANHHSPEVRAALVRLRERVPPRVVGLRWPNPVTRQAKRLRDLVRVRRGLPPQTSTGPAPVVEVVRH